MPKPQLVDIECNLVHSTKLAYLFQCVDTEEEIWCPRSLCEVEYKGDGFYTVTMERETAREKGFIE